MDGAFYHFWIAEQVTAKGTHQTSTLLVVSEQIAQSRKMIFDDRGPFGGATDMVEDHFRGAGHDRNRHWWLMTTWYS